MEKLVRYPLNSLVKVYETVVLTQLFTVKQALRKEGVYFTVAPADYDPYYSVASGLITLKLFVARGDEKRAREILKNYPTHSRTETP